jgi:lactate permease
MSLFLALLPIGVAAVLLIGLQRGALQTGLATLAVAAAITLVWPEFTLAPSAFMRALGQGAATALVVLLVLLPSLLLYHLLQATGSMQVLAQGIARVSADHDLQVLILVLGLAPFVESVSGFGVAMVVVIPLLIALGVSVFRAALLGIIGQMSVPWGALAVGTTLGADLTGLDPNLLGARTALLTAPLPASYGLVALGLSGGWPAIRRWGSTAFVAGALFAFLHYGFSWRPGVELAGVLSSLVTIGLLVGWGRLAAPPPAHAPLSSAIAEGEPTLPLWKAVAPYVILTILLLISRVVLPLRAWLQQHAVLELPELGLSLPLLYTPGFYVLVAALAALPILGVSRAMLVQVSSRAWRHFAPSAIAITSFLAVAQLLSASGMIAELGRVGLALGANYSWVAPLIGALGGWITGSNVGSNSLFSPLQQVAGVQANLPLDWLMGAQNGAGSHATLIAPARMILASTAAGLVGVEGRLLRAAGPLVLLSIVVITLGLVWVNL